MSFAAGAFSSGARGGGHGGGHSSGNEANRRQFGGGGQGAVKDKDKGKDKEPGGGGKPGDPGSNAGLTTTSLAMAFQALASKSSAALMGDPTQK